MTSGKYTERGGCISQMLKFQGMLVLSNNDIDGLLSQNEIIDAVEAAIIALEEGKADVPQRLHLGHGENIFLCMPSLAADYFGTKLVSVVPGNRGSNLPVTIGAMLLSDAKTGAPLALMNASRLTALRTGAVGALAIRHLTPDTEDTVGIIGCGVQGLHQAVFACAVRKISRIFFVARTREQSDSIESFVHTHYPDVEVVRCQSAAELLQKTNIVIAATTSAVPVLPDDEALLRRKHFFSIGSYKMTMQELPDAAFKLAGRLVIDSAFARHEVGDVINPLKKGILRDDQVHTLGQVIRHKINIDVHDTTAFKSAGMALFDLFAASAMFEKAEQLGRGISVSL